MKKIIFVLFLISLGAQLAGAQNIRYSEPFPSISSVTVVPFLVANIAPNLPILAVCAHPANQVPCTNYATTYNSAGTACSNGAQDTPDPQPSNCQATGDAQGNIGFWARAGTYDYTVCIQNTTQCFGPYTITLSSLVQKGSCGMVLGECAPQVFSPAYTSNPVCTVTWTGSGTLTGFLQSNRTTTSLRPQSSVNTDIGLIDWICVGNPT